MSALTILSGVFSLVLTGIAGFLFPDRPARARTQSGIAVLLVFLFIALILGAVVLASHWKQLLAARDTVLGAAVLMVAMIGGMFARVIARNYELGHEPFDLKASQLLYPLVFSVIVFYPIWVQSGSTSPSFFAVHAAFLNGYFWESVVSAAQAPV